MMSDKEGLDRRSIMKLAGAGVGWTALPLSRSLKAGKTSEKKGRLATGRCDG